MTNTPTSSTLTQLAQSALGQKSAYHPFYDASLLYPIPRAGKREEIGIVTTEALAFHGFDRWQHYEVSWLNQRGKPLVAIADICYPCTSPNIIESKSMKLYFNSFNNTRFNDLALVQSTLQRDLSQAVGANVSVKLMLLNEVDPRLCVPQFDGICLDDLDIDCDTYRVNSAFLTTETSLVEQETVYSDLLKSNCLVTNQPDWGSVAICYSGKKIAPSGLLRYIVSFRDHNEFHEQCIERIFMDIWRCCQPTYLTVDGRYTRRGGLDINPYRSSHALDATQLTPTRLCRQ